MNTLVLVFVIIGGLLLTWGCWGILFFMIDDIIAKAPHKYRWLPGGWG